MGATLGMLTRADLEAFILRFETSQATEADRQLLHQILLANEQGANEQAIQQLGKYGVNVGEGHNIHIGDIIQGARPELIRAITQELLAFQSHGKNTPDNSSSKPTDDIPLEYLELQVDTQMIQLINTRLAFIKELYNARQLTESQLEKLKSLKSQLYPLVKINQDLRELAAAFNQLLQEAIQSLTEKLQELDASKSDSFVTIHMQNCLQQYQELLLQLQIDLEEGKEVANWLDAQRSGIAELLGKYALSNYPELEEAMSPKSVEAFYFSIIQFLERLSHCLTWGRKNCLEFPITPVVLDDKVYATAFEYLMELLPKELPNRGIEQLQEYISFLVERLPSYRHIEIK